MILRRMLTSIARVVFITTMLLGLLSWVAQLFVLKILLKLFAQIHLTSIHEAVGLIGTLALLSLAGMAVFKRDSRLLGGGSIIYALLVPAFGLTQQRLLVGMQHWLIQVAHLLIGIGAMVLVRRLEKRPLALKLREHRARASMRKQQPYLSHMIPKRRVAVIGAGVSGLAAAKCLLEESLEPAVFEQAAEIGGVWKYHEELPTGGGVMYRSLRTNTSRQTFGFSDFPLPDMLRGGSSAFSHFR